MKKRVVVTGGAGFLGAALVKHLLKEGHQVAVLDNFWRGKRANLAGHEANTSLFVIEGDVTVSADLDRCAAALGGVDLIHHMAAVNGTRWFDEAPLKVIDVNINGTLAVL
ncbi:MAG: SDR family NAD(P)-dependent oxidoreductase, partial [Poseidonia sp.]